MAATKKTAKAKRALVGKPATADYSSFSHSYYTQVRDLPVFSFNWIRAMLIDPTVRLGLAMRAAPLAQAQFGRNDKDATTGKTTFQPGVASPNQEVAKFVEKQLMRIWRNELHKITRAQVWGWSGCEVEYKLNSSNQVAVKKLLPRHAMDTLPLTEGGEVKGVQFRGLKKQGHVNLLFPKACWHSYSPESDSPFGQSVLYGAFSPWCDKWLDGGALDVRRLFCHKDAYGGMSMGYPSGTTEDDQGNEVPNRDIAREIVEQAKAGNVLTFPSDVDPATGKALWTVEQATIPSNPLHILQYPKDLDIEILRGIEIPDDMLISDKTGAWQGKQVPMLAFFVNSDRWLSQIVGMVVSQILEPLVLLNWGSAIDFEVTTKPLAEQAMEQIKPDASKDEDASNLTASSGDAHTDNQLGTGQRNGQSPVNGKTSRFPLTRASRFSLTDDTNAAERLVGSGAIQAAQLVDAGRKMLGLDADTEDDLTADQVADMFDLDTEERQLLEV